jgi:hypothetical protein
MTQRITTEQVQHVFHDIIEAENPVLERQHWQRLEEKLLSLGGKRVVLEAYEPFAARLLERGKMFDSLVQLRPGAPHQCHANAAELWARDLDRLQLVTGYACDGDLWVAHSWVLEGKTFLETTGKFERYFGFLLTPIEAHKFFFEHVIAHEFPDPSRIPKAFWDARPGLLSLTMEIATAMRMSRWDRDIDRLHRRAETKKARAQKKKARAQKKKSRCRK